MKDNLSVIISVIILVVLIIIFPLYNYFERQDDMSYNLVLKSTTNFVDEVLQAGYISQDMYNRYINKIVATGNFYDVQIEAHKRILVEDKEQENIYGEQYIKDYNQDIFDLETSDAKENNARSNINLKQIKNGVYILNEGDYFFVKTKNSSTTMAGAIFDTIVPTSSKDRIVVSYGGIVKNNTWQEASISNSYIKDIGIKAFRETKKDDDPAKIKLEGSQVIEYTVNVLNAAEGIGSDDISKVLKDNIVLKNTKIGSTIKIPATRVTAENSTTFKVIFELNSSKTDEYLGVSETSSNFVINLPAGLIQGPVTKNIELVSEINGSVLLERGSASATTPTISLNTSEVITKGNLEASIHLNGAVFNGDLNELGIDIERVGGFLADSLRITKSGDVISIRYEGVSGDTSKNYSLSIGKTKPDWAKKWKDGVLINVGEVNSSNFRIKNTVQSFSCTNTMQEYKVTIDGFYKLEVWGAQGGGNTVNEINMGGRGGYSMGIKELKAGDSVYVYVGQKGGYYTAGGWNGGGNAGPSGYKGGGATDIRLVSGAFTDLKSLNSRIIVAGGGGGSDNISYDSIADNGRGGAGGGENTSGLLDGYIDGVRSSTISVSAILGIGQDARVAGDGILADQGGGGGGYHGGMGSNHYNGGGAGGTGYIGGVESKIINSIQYNKTTLNGDSIIPTHDSGTTMKGNKQDGFAKISYLGK